jgi:hypothetical protein
VGDRSRAHDRRSGVLSQDTLEQAHDPKAFDPELDKAEASKRIDQLKQEQGR